MIHRALLYKNCDHENATFIRHNELVSNYERSKGPLTMTQHAELIQTLEKRLAKGSQIQQDYLRAKAADTSPPNTWAWLKTMLRIGQVLAEARSMTNLINPDVVYPSSATRMWCTLHRLFRLRLVKKRQAEQVLRHPHLLHPGRLSHLQRLCVQRARTFRLSTDSLSLRRRKCRSYRTY